MKIKLLSFMSLCGFALFANAQSMDWLCHPGEFSQVSYLGHDLFKVKDSNEKWGIIHAEGHKTIDVKYDSITPFVENKALLLDKKGKRLLGIIDNDGKMIKDVSASEFYVTQYANYKENRLSFTNKDGLSGYLNDKGEIAVEPDYYLAAPYQNGIAAVQYQSGDYGLINKGGRSAIISNSEYPFISSPVDGYVLAITGSRKGANALKLCKIEGPKLKTVKTFEDGMNIWLSDDFTTIECQKGNRYYIDNQWRISGSNSGNKLPAIKDEAPSFITEISQTLGKTNVEGGLRITYLGHPIVNNVFPDVSTVDNYAIVYSRDGKVGVLRLNKSAAIDIKAPTTPVTFHHSQPVDVLLDVDLKAVNPDKLYWYRNETGYLTHSSLEYHNGKYQLRMPYFKANTRSNEISRELIDIAFTYDGLDWMHHTFTLESVHRNQNSYDVTISGDGMADADGKCTLTINVSSLNGLANGKVTVNGLKIERFNGKSVQIPVTVSVPDNASKNFSFHVNIEEEGCPSFSKNITQTVQGQKTEHKRKKKIKLE